ncbi:methyltransferase domain-containing protein [Fodinibius sp. Rm-B-1B1-1]|uniref:methyltransferase domain-containing protein n=1 Tax=Fodinibius alkaliphilus TaxID=3140241 RepID=UPI00315A865E
MSEQDIVEWSSIKEHIAQSFGQDTLFYDEHAEVQREVADRLIASLQPWRDIIPSGPIAELGVGTGFVTEGIAELYPDRKIEAYDLSLEMIDFCKDTFSGNENLSFSVSDVEEVPEFEDPHYAMTVSGFAAHWFKDPAQTLAKWLEIIKPGGLLLASFPGNESFPQWKKHCQELGLPFTGNELPDVEEMVIKMSVGPAQVDYYEDTITQTYESADDFFEELKQLGMGTQIKGRHLTSDERQLLVDHWDNSTEGDITVNYHVVFLAVKRDFDS